MNCLQTKPYHFFFNPRCREMSFFFFKHLFYTSVSSYLFSLSTCTFVEKMILTVNQFPERKIGRGKRNGGRGSSFVFLSMGAGGGYEIPLKAIQGAIHVKRKWYLRLCFFRTNPVSWLNKLVEFLFWKRIHNRAWTPIRSTSKCGRGQKWGRAGQVRQFHSSFTNTHKTGSVRTKSSS